MRQNTFSYGLPIKNTHLQRSNRSSHAIPRTQNQKYIQAGPQSGPVTIKGTLSKTQRRCVITPSDASLKPKTLKMKLKRKQCFRACYATSQTKWFWEIRKEKWTVVAIPTLTAVNARITIPDMANGGRPRPTCDRLHRELSAGVNSPPPPQKKGVIT